MIMRFGWSDGELTEAHNYILPAVIRLLAESDAAKAGSKDIFDLGCGNGSVMKALTTAGWDVVGVDPSIDGVEQAKREMPSIAIYQASADESLSTRFGTFTFVISLEVIEHVYDPRRFAATLASLLKPGGAVILSTPYHSYLKNLALSLSGKMDDHFTVLWDHGHIKFWSIKTLSKLLYEAGLEVFSITRVGRIPILAKSMIIMARHRETFVGP